MLYYDGCDGCTTGSLLALLYCVAACMLVRIARLRRLDHEQNSKAATLHGMACMVPSRRAQPNPWRATPSYTRVDTLQVTDLRAQSIARTPSPPTEMLPGH